LAAGGGIGGVGAALPGRSSGGGTAVSVLTTGAFEEVGVDIRDADGLLADGGPE
jgi:hypothetical protein